MNFAQNQSLKIFLTGLLILTIAMVIVYKYSYSQTLTNELHHTEFIVDEYSKRINQIILQKVNTIKTIAVSPTLIAALNESNNYYSLLSEQKRKTEIQSRDDKWQTIEDQNDPFILKYTNNPVSKYLVNQQNNLEGEYGEIFLTNKYGSLVASTAKLTTFAHGHKYWWKGAFNDGEGAVFFDDRGYDISVGGYVLGVVVPIKSGNEIIGILKANLNILGSISEMILKSQNEHLGKLKLIRSDGLVIYEEGVEPLSKRISSEILEKLHSSDKNSYICLEKQNKMMVGISEIRITSGIEGYGFGGSFESIDHIKGNTGESWEILSYRPISILIKPIHATLARLFIIGLFLSIVLAFISLFIGKRAANPIRNLIEQIDHIAAGDFNSKVTIKRKDEIGLLAASFNKMAENLKNSTTSIDKLNAEIHERKQIEESLKESQKRFQQLFEYSPVPLFEEDYTSLITYINQLKDEGIKDFRKYFDENPSEVELCSHKIKILNVNKQALILNNVDSKNEIIENISNTFIETTLEKFKDELVGLAEGKSEYESETEIITKNAEKKQIFLKLKIHKDEKGNLDYSRCLVALLDITERKKAEAEVRKLSTAVQQSPSVIAITDIGGKLEYVNPKFTELTGYSVEEVIGLNPRILKSGELPDSIYKELWKTISSGEIWRGEFHNKKKNGDLFWEAASISPITNKDGKIINYIKMAEDITDRKIREKELQDTTIQLKKQFEKSEKQRIANLVILNDLTKTTKKLRSQIIERIKAEDQVKRDLEEKKTLLQELYHRTKNNMQVISSMLKIQSRRSDNEFLQTSFNEIIGKINAMSLVHQKLYQAKDLSRIDLSDYIHDLTHLITRGYSLQAKYISFKYDMQKIFVLIDTVMPLGLVLNELITNVFKHAFPKNSKGEICIEMKLDSDNTINIHLSDNGVGIPDNLDLRQTKSMGLQTMYSLIEHQLQGSVEYKVENGLKWHIKLNDTINSKRV